MKRILQCSIVLLVIVVFSMNAFAAVKPTEPAELNYVCARECKTMFTIGSDGMATMKGTLVPKTSTSIDEVKVTFTIENLSGDNVYNKTWNAPWNDLIGAYNTVKEYQLSKKGSYVLYVKFRCYKNEKLVETIYGTSIRKTYS